VVVLALFVACTGTESVTGGSEKTSAAADHSPRWFGAACNLPLKYLERIDRGTFGRRSPDIQLVPHAPNFFGGFGPTSHSGPWPYLQKVPLVFYGPGYVEPAGRTALEGEVTLADLAPTLADVLGLAWPTDRAGRSLTEVLVPPEQRPVPPRLVVLVAWDGGGWDVLHRYPNSWPNLRDLMGRGATLTNAIVGSSPSVTPAVHATIGTGTFPSQHGIVDIPLRDHGEMFDSWAGRSPKYLRVPALGDLWDEQTANAAQIGVVAYKAWHIAMIGHGAFYDGADKDVAVITERKSGGNLVTNSRYYTVPDYLREVKGLRQDILNVDLTDGQRDSTWLGNNILDDPEDVMKTPAWVFYQTRLIKHLLAGNGFGADDVPDFFATNFKQLDEAGHTWNMVEPEVRDVLSYTDAALGKLIAFLNANVGEGSYVVAVTADHGQTPHPRTTGAWPINIEQMRQATASHFKVDADDLFVDERVTGFWLSPAFLRKHDISAGQISQFLLGHTIEDNNPPGQQVPDEYKDRLTEPVFDAVFPTHRLTKIIECAQGKD
jgi:Type I phosphodiesterase / nucleotide pyrophosphatase